MHTCNVIYKCVKTILMFCHATGRTAARSDKVKFDNDLTVDNDNVASRASRQRAKVMPAGATRSFTRNSPASRSMPVA